MDSSGPVARVVVYGDFADPWSYLASQRLDALVDHGVPVEWRAVEWHRRRPVKGLRLDARTRPEAAGLLERVREQCGLEEWLPETPPELLPKTEAAVSALAEAYGAGVGDQVRRGLFEAYWRKGTDIGNPEVLRTLLAGDFIHSQATSDPVRRFGYAVAMTRAPITTAAWRLIKQWRERWESLDEPGMPTVVEGARTLSGRVACEHLAARAAERQPGQVPAARRIERDLPMPSLLVGPPATWVTQVGDPWQRESRLSHT